jgi:two-component system OmpR family sensor kinase
VRPPWPPRPLSLRGRLLALVLALLFCGLAVADLATYAALRSFLVGRVDRQLDGTFGNVVQSMPAFGGHGMDTRSLRQLGQVAPGVYAEWRDPDGETVDVVPGGHVDLGPSVPRLPDRLPSLRSGPGAGRESVAYLTVPAVQRGGPPFRVRAARFGFGRGVLMLALPLGDMSATLRRLLLVEALVTATVLALAVAVGLWLVRLGLRPLDDISATAATIARGDLTRRVARSEPDTEVGRLGQALNLMLGQIEAAFAERQASEARLRQSEERLRRFAGDASHELRTPLAAIRAYAELFRRGADRHPEDLPRLLRRIESEAARMGGLVDDLLLLARLDQGRPLERHPVDLGAVAAEAVEAARAVDPGRPLELAIGLTDSVEVLGDQDRLRQVVDNLLGNVRAHTPPGTPARVRVWSEDGTGLVEVADDGPGLTMEQAERVFERFYRADSSRSRAPAEPGREGGSGLGLSIVAAIAAAHGGRALVRSTPGDGALFRVELPLLAGAATPNGNGQAPPADQAGGASSATSPERPPTRWAGAYARPVPGAVGASGEGPGAGPGGWEGGPGT